MGTDTNTFIDIFNTSFEVGGEAVQLRKIGVVNISSVVNSRS